MLRIGGFVKRTSDCTLLVLTFSALKLFGAFTFAGSDRAEAYPGYKARTDMFIPQLGNVLCLARSVQALSAHHGASGEVA
jgi:hypothetical protein